MPAPISALTATADGATSIALTWANPIDADFTGVIIRRQTGATAPGWNSGVLVIDTAKADTSFTDTGLIAGGPLSYAAFSHDAAGNHAAAVKVTATLPLPPAPVLPHRGAVVQLRWLGRRLRCERFYCSHAQDFDDGHP